MGESWIEKIRNAPMDKAVFIPATDEDGHSHGVEIYEDRIYLHGCDCAVRLDSGRAEELYQALGAYLRIQRNRERKEGKR